MAPKKTTPNGTTPTAGDPGKKPARGLKVVCTKDGFWRGGIQWFREPKIVPLDKLDNKQLALITKEPKLKVEHVDLD